MYGNNPQTIPDLKAAITAAIRAIPREVCGRVIEELYPPDPNVPAGQESSFGAPVKQRVFVVRT